MSDTTTTPPPGSPAWTARLEGLRRALAEREQRGEKDTPAAKEIREALAVMDSTERATGSVRHALAPGGAGGRV